LVSHASVVIVGFLFAFFGYTVEPLSIEEQQHRPDDSQTVYHVTCRVIDDEPPKLGRKTRFASKSLGLAVPSMASDFVDNKLGWFIKIGSINRDVAGM
jgi:hypothetical protein